MTQGKQQADHEPQDDHPKGVRLVDASELKDAPADQNALRVISRLQRHGHEAYLVGGCVRDMLLGRRPKDFDVATSAHPRQVKRLFRNGRIIGRRFRLVHVIFGRAIVETATFRRAPSPEGRDLLIREDNEYGTAGEDAERRDFTVNGLFLDPAHWQIHDFVGGLGDLEERVLRTIGPAQVRLAEDPVRILRAVKFATRLGFRIEDRTWDAMCAGAGDLVRSAPPRVIEEIFRLMQSGTSLGAFRMLRACGALSAILPGIDRFLGKRDDPDPAAHDRADSYWRLLEALDSDIHGGSKPSQALLLAVLFLRLVEVQLAAEPDKDPHRLVREVVEPLALEARLARRVVARCETLLAYQPRFTQRSSKSFRPLLFMRSEAFPEALHLFRLRSAAWGQGWDVYEGWCDRYARAREVGDEELASMRKKKRRRSRRRPRRKRSDPNSHQKPPPDSRAG